MTKLFLSAEWRHLIMLNYEVDPEILIPYIPAGTELDLWKGRAFISLVGFMFLNTRVCGFSFPFHRNFEEVNLRLYLKRTVLDEERRGVAFIKEIVPRRTLAYIANRLYNENYIALPMRHRIETNPLSAEYSWNFNNKWQTISAIADGAPQIPQKNSEAEFITEHYWGYSGKAPQRALEYQVKHPPWRVSNVTDYEIDVDVCALYGSHFGPFLEKPPVSVFLAEGSDVQVFRGTRL